MKKILFLLSFVFTHIVFAQNSLFCEVVDSDNQKDPCVLDTVLEYCFSTISIEQNPFDNNFSATITKVGKNQLAEVVLSFPVSKMVSQDSYIGHGIQQDKPFNYFISASSTENSYLKVGRFVLPLNCSDSERVERKKRF